MQIIFALLALSSLPHGGARGQNLVLNENSKSIGWGYMCLSGHFY